MFSLIFAGYGLSAGVIFFIYLWWFMHIRDHVEGRRKRFFYYFIVVVIFCLVGLLTGASPVLGVIPVQKKMTK